MNPKISRLASAWLAMPLLIACLSAPASANLLANPGFEDSNSSLEAWVPFTFTSTSTLDTSNPHTGNNAVIEVGGTATTGSTGIFQQVDGIAENTEYTLSLWAKAGALPISSDDTFGGALATIVFENDSGASGTGNDLAIHELALGPLGTDGVVRTGNGLLSTTYQQYFITATSPPDTAHVKVQLYSRHSDQAIFFDDISLTRVLPPDTPTFSLTVDRDTGNISLENGGTGSGNVESIQITSASGALDPIQWKSVAGNYDTSGGTSNGSVDGNDAWTRQVETNFELTENEAAGDGGVITVGQIVDLGNDTWVKSFREDLEFEVTYTDNSTFSANVTYTGGPNSASYQRSDLNFDGSIDATDWPLLRDQLFVDLGTTSQAVAYQSGDLTGDLKTNFADFNRFKSDFNAANGVGAFEAMVASVPEPTSLALLVIGVLGVSLSRKRRETGLCKIACLLLVALTAATVAPSTTYAAQSVDFTTFAVDDYPLIDSSRFNFVTYTSTTNSAVLDVSSNPHFFHGGPSILNKRITGTINPGADNDYIGLALGYTAGDTTKPIGMAGTADFLLLDWKFDNSSQDMLDDVTLAGPPTFQFFHDSTAGKEASRGLAISRITGTPTGDELWGHVNSNNAGAFDDNPLGGVAELQRGTSLAFTGYVKRQDHVFDITYTPTQITVKIDGFEEINLSGSFPDGVLGLYSMDQNPQFGAPTYSNFRISDLDELLTATVNTLSGSVTLTNLTSAPIDLSGYALESASSSLDFSTWNSLQDQDLAGFDAGNGTGNGWEESTGSSDLVLVEANLDTTSVLAAGASISLGAAFDTSGSQDLVFTYNEPNDLITTGLVSYVSTVENANFDGDADVDGADFLTWQRGFGTGTTLAQGDANASGSVDGADLAIWQSQHGATGLLSGVQSVPEPSSALLLVLAGCGVGLSKARR